MRNLIFVVAIVVAIAITCAGTAFANDNAFLYVTMGGRIIDNGVEDNKDAIIHPGELRDLTHFIFASGRVADLEIIQIKLRNIGTAQDGDWAGALLVDPNGGTLADAEKSVDGILVFDFTDKPLLLPRGTSRGMKVIVSVPSGSTGTAKTLRLVIEKPEDVVVRVHSREAEHNRNEKFVTLAPLGFDQTFPIGDQVTGLFDGEKLSNESRFINRVTIRPGAVILSRSLDSPAGWIYPGAKGQVLSMWELAVTEELEILETRFSSTTTLRNDAVENVSIEVDGKLYASGVRVPMKLVRAIPKLVPGEKHVIRVIGDIAQDAPEGLLCQVSISFLNIRRSSGEEINPEVDPVPSNWLIVSRIW